MEIEMVIVSPHKQVDPSSPVVEHVLPFSWPYDHKYVMCLRLLKYYCSSHWETALLLFLFVSCWRLTPTKLRSKTALVSIYMQTTFCNYFKLSSNHPSCAVTNYSMHVHVIMHPHTEQLAGQLIRMEYYKACSFFMTTWPCSGKCIGAGGHS